DGQLTLEGLKVNISPHQSISDTTEEQNIDGDIVQQQIQHEHLEREISMSQSPNHNLYSMPLPLPDNSDLNRLPNSRNQPSISDDNYISDIKIDSLKRNRDLAIVGVGLSALGLIAGITMIATMYPAGGINVVAIPFLITVPSGLLTFCSVALNGCNKKYNDLLQKKQNQQNSTVQAMEGHGQSLSGEIPVVQNQRLGDEGQVQPQPGSQAQERPQPQVRTSASSTSPMPKMIEPQNTFAGSEVSPSGDLRSPRDHSPRGFLRREGSMGRQ
ncbi:MAG: hypothetical protein ACKO47_04335, partial [Alphaproteobacteria bacterium]